MILNGQRCLETAPSGFRKSQVTFQVDFQAKQSSWEAEISCGDPRDPYLLRFLRDLIEQYFRSYGWFCPNSDSRNNLQTKGTWVSMVCGKNKGSIQKFKCVYFGDPFSLGLALGCFFRCCVIGYFLSIEDFSARKMVLETKYRRQERQRNQMYGPRIGLKGNIWTSVRAQ